MALDQGLEPLMVGFQPFEPALNEFKFGHGYTTSKMHSARRDAEFPNSSVSLQKGFTRPRDAAARIGLYNTNFEPLRGNDVAPYLDVTGHHTLYGAPPYPCSSDRGHRLLAQMPIAHGTRWAPERSRRPSRCRRVLSLTGELDMRSAIRRRSPRKNSI